MLSSQPRADDVAAEPFIVPVARSKTLMVSKGSRGSPGSITPFPVRSLTTPPLSKPQKSGVEHAAAAPRPVMVSSRIPAIATTRPAAGSRCFEERIAEAIEGMWVFALLLSNWGTSDDARPAYEGSQSTFLKERVSIEASFRGVQPVERLMICSFRTRARHGAESALRADLRRSTFPCYVPRRRGPRGDSAAPMGAPHGCD